MLSDATLHHRPEVADQSLRLKNKNEEEQKFLLNVNELSYCLNLSPRLMFDRQLHVLET